MAYLSLYRKYRPQKFSDVVGQDAIIKALGNQILSEKTVHTYLFTGTRGTGKTTVAKIFAKAVNCENLQPDGSPCCECDVCRGISDGSFINVIELDAASNRGVENVRTIIDEVGYRPQRGKKKVYIIDEAHMLTLEAFNAFLKTLEEPPDYAMFILATTDVGRIPITILSRCQRYDFHRLPAGTLIYRMESILASEEYKAEDKALSFIARQADGSMRDALSLLDQCLAYHPGEILTYDNVLDDLGAVDVTVFSSMTKYVSEGDLRSAIILLDDTVMKGRDIQTFVIDYIGYLRSLMLISADGSTKADIADVLGVSEDTYEQMKQLAKRFDTETIMRFIRIFSELSSEIKYSTQKKTLTEVAIVRLMHPEMQDDSASAKQRLAIIERKLDRLEREGIKSQPVAMQQEKPSEKKPLPEALPEDIKLVCDNWGRIIKDSQEMVRGILAEAKPSVDGTKLVIVCKDEISSGSLRRYDGEIREILRRETKKEMNFEIFGPEKGEDPDTRYPNLESMINYDDIKITD